MFCPKCKNESLVDFK
ncbi:hypothetical protein [Waltera sp.]